MPQKIAKHINSFDFFKATVVSILLVSPIYWGFSTNNYPLGMSFVVGVLFAYFSNIEGTNRNRIIGMILSFLLGFSILSIGLLINDLSQTFNILIFVFLIFGVSMISVYGFRGSLIAFSGLFAIVMSFMFQKYKIPSFDVLRFVAFGGLVYIFVSALSQFLFQKRHIQILLSECMELTATYLKINDDIKWKKEDNSPDLQYKLLKIQSAINDNHELLRSMVVSEKSKLISSTENRKLYLLLKEMIDLYEMAIAWNPDLEVFEEELGEHVHLLNPFQKASELVSEYLLILSAALRTNSGFLLDRKIEETLKAAESNIDFYVEKVKLPKAREGALMLRNLLDQQKTELEKLSLIDNIYNNLLQNFQFIPQGNSQFITTQNYSWNTLKSSLTTESVIFRHSIRLTIAFLLSYFIGNAINPDYTNWTIVTILVILRPNYGLTKNRAMGRMTGTILGMIFTLILVYFFSNYLIYGITAAISLWLGFSLINKNFRIGSAGITVSILLLYVMNENDSIETILNRGLFTFIGVLISLFAMYFIWPVWEKESIKESIKKAMVANLSYLSAVNFLYKTKQPSAIAYRLSRKDAFLTNANLNGVFQRLQDEPKSKRHQLSSIYAVVLLNHNFLSAVAAYSAFIQNHITTEVSESFLIIMDSISFYLQNAVYVLEGTSASPREDKSIEAFEILDQKYADLNQKRNQEIQSGVLTMSLEMRNKLQEVKSIIGQLKELKNLSEHILGAVEILG